MRRTFGLALMALFSLSVSAQSRRPLPDLCLNPPPIPGISHELIAYDNKLISVKENLRWKPGSTLKVYFFPSSDERYNKSWYSEKKDLAIKLANEWSDHANIKFAQTSNINDAEIRVKFNPSGGHYSYLGKVALKIPKNQQTLNLGFSPRTKFVMANYKRVVIHEFGHALGFQHEHFHPKSNIQWDKEKVYAEYRRNQGWDRAQVDRQVFQTLDPNQTNFSEYDSKSIMHYPILARHLKRGYEHQSVGWNNELSATDKRYSALLYPHSSERREKPLYWSKRGNEIFQVKAGENFGPLKFTSIDPNGDIVDYEIIKNSCSFKNLKKKVVNGSLILRGLVDEKERSPKCSLDIRPSTEEKVGQIKRVTFKIEKVEDRRVAPAPITWDNGDHSVRKTVEKGESIRFELEASHPSLTFAFNIVKNTCDFPGRIQKGFMGSSLVVSIPSSSKKSSCSFTIQPKGNNNGAIGFAKEFILRLVGPRMKLSWRSSWKTRTFYIKESGKLPSFLLGAKYDGQKEVSLRRFGYSCPFNLNVKQNANSWSIGGNQVSFRTYKAECEVKFKAVAGALETFTKTVVFKILKSTEKETIPWKVKNLNPKITLTRGQMKKIKLPVILKDHFGINFKVRHNCDFSVEDSKSKNVLILKMNTRRAKKSSCEISVKGYKGRMETKTKKLKISFVSPLKWKKPELVVVENFRPGQSSKRIMFPVLSSYREPIDFKISDNCQFVIHTQEMENGVQFRPFIPNRANSRYSCEVKVKAYQGNAESPEKVLKIKIK